MPDLLAHALLAYAVARLLAWRVDWLTPGYTTVAMAGAFVPDLAKAELLVPSARVESLLAVPFDWFALHTGGGTLVAVLVGGVLVGADERRRVLGLLGLGAATHLLADALLLSPSGRSYAVLWPLTRYHPPTPGLYLSTDPTPTVVAALVAAVVWAASERRDRETA
ncbi:MAG: metal-dependent hydrolase [Haloferacaceae archaeon]